MKNTIRTFAAAALLAAGLCTGCASDSSKSGMTGDKGMEKSSMAMDHKTCPKCGMACDASGKCPHCDAAMMNK